MARTKFQPKATAILAADIHLTDRVPVCREPGEFHASMFGKLDAIAELQRTNGDCPVLVAGDITDRWNLPPWIIREGIERIRNWIVIPGQHDLPQHRVDAHPKSALAVLEAAGCVKVLTNSFFHVWENSPDVAVTGFPWGAAVSGITPSLSSNVALVHHLVYPNKKKPPFPGAESVGSTAQTLLKKMRGYDLVVTGDNHETFTYGGGHFHMGPDDPWVPGDKEEPILVNPGSMMRTSTKQINHVPSVFLWYCETNTVKRVSLPYIKGAVSREHIEKQEAKDDRIEVFINRLSNEVEVGLNFKHNLRVYMAENVISTSVQDLVWKSLEGGTCDE